MHSNVILDPDVQKLDGTKCKGSNTPIKQVNWLLHRPAEVPCSANKSLGYVPPRPNTRPAAD